MSQSNWLEMLQELVKSASSDTERESRARLNELRDSPNESKAETPAASDGTADAMSQALKDLTAVWREESSGLREKLGEVARMAEAQVRSIEENTSVLTQGLASRAGEAIKAAATSIPGLSGLPVGAALSPVVSGIARLFGRTRNETPPVMTPYPWPARQSVAGTIEPTTGASGPGRSEAQAGAPRPGAGPQVTIQVQAIDSRSFLDHSVEIARAVREAMLESHAISDIVNEL